MFILERLSEYYLSEYSIISYFKHTSGRWHWFTFAGILKRSTN